MTVEPINLFKAGILFVDPCIALSNKWNNEHSYLKATSR